MLEGKLYTVTMKYEDGKYVVSGYRKGTSPEEAMQVFLREQDDFIPFHRENRYVVTVKEATDGGFPDHTMTGTIDQLLNHPTRPETTEGIH